VNRRSPRSAVSSSSASARRVASGELPPPSPRTNLVYQLSDYELRHLVSHLAEAGRDGDLHRLMRLELRESRGDDHANVENAWYAAQSRGGDFTTYAQDVERAWRLATEASLTEARSGGDAAGAGLEVRYALLAASLAARAHKIRPPLALALIQKGLWTFERGLAYARQLPRPARRVQALNGLAPLASPPQRMSLLREALAEAREVEGEVSYTLEFAPPPTTPAQAVAALAPSLPESLFDEALDIALVADELQRAEAVVELAPHLPPALLDRALAAAWALDPVVQAEPLAALAARLSGPARASLVEEGLRAWHRLDHRDEKRGRLLQLLAPHLDEANYPPAPSVPELLRFGSLPEVAVAVSLARSRSGSEGRKLLEEAEAALERKALEELDAARLKDDRDRGRLLASLAPHLPEAALRPALSLALELPGEWDRPDAVIALAPILPPPLALEALEHVRAMSHPDPRARCLAALVHRLPDAAKISTLDELVEDARGIDTDDHVGMRADVLAAAAPHMTVHQLRRAVSVAEALEDGHERAQALAAIARLLPPADRRPIFNDALAAARTRGAWALAVMLTAFGPLPQGAASVALAAAREQPDAGGRAWVLAQVVPSLTEPERTKVLAEALAEGQARTPMAVVIAFAPIAATLPHDVFVAVLDALATDSADVTFLETFTPYMPDDLLPRAHEIARAEPDVHRRAEALIALAPRSEAASNDALEAVLSRDESWWPSDLRRLAPYLPQELLEQAWQAARVSEIGRAQRLAALAPHFAEPRRRSALLEAIEAALALRPRERIEVLQELEPSFRGRGWREALALAKIPFHWGVPDRGSRINEGVERLRGARSPRDRASAARELLEFEPHLPPPLLAEALEAVCSNVEWRGEDYRVALLAQLAEPLASLARDDLGPIWSQAIHTLGTTANERGHLLAEIQALAPVLAALGGPAGLREAAGGIRDAGAWFP
jgi:hypothetical protein